MVAEASIDTQGLRGELDMSEVLRERFSSGQGVVMLARDMSDEALLQAIKSAISFSGGMAFVVVPPETA
jgi:hypothetical protein